MRGFDIIARLFPAITFLLLAGCTGGSSNGDGAPARAAPARAAPELGIVTVVPGPCQRMSSLPRTSCSRVSVASPGVAALGAEVAVTEPAAGVPVRGTVVFGTGGGGGGWYEIDPVASAMLMRLSADGWRLVQRGWDGASGWITGPGGMLAVSNRYATLLTWIHETVHAGGGTMPFCATGNSGGSAELSYALARWDRGEILDLAVPTSGPPIVALDHFCLDGADATWLAECQALVPASTFACGPSPPWCAYSMGSPGPRTLVDDAFAPETPCASQDASARARLLADSVVAPGARFEYPRTKVDFLYGVLDCSEAVPGGHYYASKITSSQSVRYLAATDHPVFSFPTGAAAIESAINTDCVARH